MSWVTLLSATDTRLPRPRGERGYVLLPVVLTLTLVATIAFLINHETAMGSHQVASAMEAAQAQYVAEAGLAHATWQLQQDNCTGYAALPATPFTTATYAATVTPASGSPVTVTATGTLAGGTSRTVTHSHTTIYDAPVSVVLQPDPATGKDGWINGAKPSVNYGADAKINVNSSDQRGLFAFSLASLPANARLLSAQLEIYQSNVNSPGVVGVHRVTAPWTEGSCTGPGGCPANGATWDTTDGAIPWTTPGSDYDPTPTAKQAIAVNGWYTWNISALAEAWAAATVANQGVVLIGSGGFDGKYAGSDDTNPALRPKLTITYACECGVPCGGGGGPCNGTFRDEFNNPVYSGNDGTLSWTGDWQEVNESDGPTSGDEQVFADLFEVPAMPTYQLVVRDNDGGGEGVMRALNLNSAATAILSFDYKPYGLDSSSDYASVQISTTGTAGPWTEVVRFAGPASATAYQPFSIDISAYSSADAAVRILTSPTMGPSDYVFFDNLQIECRP